MPTIINLENIEYDLGAKIHTNINYNDKGCKLCGEYHKIEECHILTNIQHIQDSKVPTRARLTLPTELRVETMSDGSCNVVAQVPLAKGTRFGPFEAKKILALNPLITFPIKLFKLEENDDEYYFDPNNEEISNWMCFVAVASDASEQNLICYQMKNDIYYSAIRDIKAGEYLKVWYASYYAEKMGAAVLETRMIDVVPAENDIKIEKQMNQKVAETLPAESLGAVDNDKSVWNCRFCKATIKNVVIFSTHLQEHYKDLALNTFSCKICYKRCYSEKALLNHQIIVHSMNPNNMKLPLIGSAKDDAQQQQQSQHQSQQQNMEISNTNNNSIGGYFKKDATNNFQFTKMDVYDADLDFNTKTIVNDSLVGGQTQDQLENNSLLEQSPLLDNITLNTLNYNQDLNNVMLSKISELNEHLKFDIKETNDLNDSLNTDSLHDILCEDDSKASKIAQEKSIADFSLDFVESNGIHLNSTDNTTLSTNDATVESTSSGTGDQQTPITGPPYQCDICHKEFQIIEYLIRHLKKHSGEFTCCECFAVFARRENFLNHSCKWNPKKNNVYECMYCSKGFSEQKYLNRHIQRHNQKKTCTKCRKLFENVSELDNHVCDPSNNPPTPVVAEKKFECDICKNKYSKNSYLRGHIRKCHGTKKPEQTEQLICYMCGEVFAASSSLKAHLLTHQPKKFGCDVCDKKFHRLDMCEQHKLTHQNIQFECTTCSKTFKSQKSLKKHRQLHNDSVVNHKCEYCNKTFIQKYNLEKHINYQHSSDRPNYPCDLCPKIYTTLNNLTEHKLTHNITESKLLHCEYCHKKFTKNHLLKSHYVQNHIGRMFSCPYCTTIVKHRASIRRHLSKSHREQRSEWDNPEFIGKLVSQRNTNKAPDNINIISSTTMASSTDTNAITQVPMSSQVESVTSSCTNSLSGDTQTILSSTSGETITVLQAAPTNPTEMETDDIHQQQTTVLTTQTGTHHTVLESVKTENYTDQQHQQPQIHIQNNIQYTTDSIVQQVDTAHQLFNDQLEFQNIIYLKNNHEVDLDLDKITEYSNLDSATAKLSQFSDLTSSTTSQVTSIHHPTHHQLQTNTDNLPKFTRVDRSNDFDMMDIQSLISTDSGMIEFSNDLDRSNTGFSNNMNLQLQNVNLHGNANLLHVSTEDEREVTLGKNAFILDDGTIVEPQEAGNVMFYVLNQS